MFFLYSTSASLAEVQMIFVYFFIASCLLIKYVVSFILMIVLYDTPDVYKTSASDAMWMKCWKLSESLDHVTTMFDGARPSSQLDQVSVSEVLHRALIAGIGERKEGNDTNPVALCTEIPSLSAIFSLVKKVPHTTHHTAHNTTHVFFRPFHSRHIWSREAIVCRFSVSTKQPSCEMVYDLVY